MPAVVNFYLDDSGTRHPDHDPGKRAAHGYDWFALGGILIRESDEARARELHAAFCKEWGIKSPVHSVEVRARNRGFLWLEGKSSTEREKFYEALYQLMKAAPVTGLACVIDRPGYNARYLAKYGRQRWSLCKSAFSISVERAAKYACTHGCRLRVLPERCNKQEDRVLRGYYDELKAKGPPFAADTSDKYGPLSAGELRATLYEFRLKAKTSPMAQLADLYLWPMCMGGYRTDNRPYKRLMEDGKLIECGMPSEDWPMLATKYYCFDLVTPVPQCKNPER
jgi:uncharacterized protein DUF3800